MKVSELITILQGIDPTLEVATHANNHTSDEHTRVGLLQNYKGAFVVIGNLSRKELNGRNDYVTTHIDGGKPLPENWKEYQKPS